MQGFTRPFLLGLTADNGLVQLIPTKGHQNLIPVRTRRHHVALGLVTTTVAQLMVTRMIIRFQLRTVKACFSRTCRTTGWGGEASSEIPASSGICAEKSAPHKANICYPVQSLPSRSERIMSPLAGFRTRGTRDWGSGFRMSGLWCWDLTGVKAVASGRGASGLRLQGFVGFFGPRHLDGRDCALVLQVS